MNGSVSQSVALFFVQTRADDIRGLIDRSLELGMAPREMRDTLSGWMYTQTVRLHRRMRDALKSAGLAPTMKTFLIEPDDIDFDEAAHIVMTNFAYEAEWGRRMDRAYTGTRPAAMNAKHSKSRK